MSAVLVADRLTRRYGGLTAINSVCWTLEQGEIHAVIGPNGQVKPPSSTSCPALPDLTAERSRSWANG